MGGMEPWHAQCDLFDSPYWPCCVIFCSKTAQKSASTFNPVGDHMDFDCCYRAKSRPLAPDLDIPTTVFRNLDLGWLFWNI